MSIQKWTGLKFNLFLTIEGFKIIDQQCHLVSSQIHKVKKFEYWRILKQLR